MLRIPKLQKERFYFLLINSTASKATIAISASKAGVCGVGVGFGVVVICVYGTVVGFAVVGPAE
jgi:hypothetical protein